MDRGNPVFLHGESHGQKRLAGYSPWGRKELDDPHKVPDTPGSLEGNTEGPATASSEPLLPS